MLTARAFLGWLLGAATLGVVLGLVAGVGVGVLVGGMLAAGALSLLPWPASPHEPQTYRLWTIFPPVREAEMWWADDWGEPLVPYDVRTRGPAQNVSLGTPLPPAGASGTAPPAPASSRRPRTGHNRRADELARAPAKLPWSPPAPAPGARPPGSGV